MKYVLVDIGCIECGEKSSLLGIFNNLKEANEIKEKCEEIQEKYWTGEHSFEIYECNKENQVIDEYYKEEIEKI